MLTGPLSSLYRRPSLQVGWLVCRNAVQRWPLIAVGIALTLLALAALGRFTALSRALDSMAASPAVMAVVSAVVFAAVLMRRRRGLASERHRDWLAALPTNLPLTLRAAGPPAVVWIGLMLGLVAAAAGAGLSASATVSLPLASAIGCLIAAAIVGVSGALRADRSSLEGRADGASRDGPPPSRYANVRRPRRAWATNPRLLPLGYWPLAQAKFWDRPKVRARSLMFLLLALPLGVTGAVALAAAVVWLITLHLINLLLGVTRVAFAASWWLAPTPVRLARFTAAVTHRALVAKIAACTLLVGMGYAIGGTSALDKALPPAIGWIAMICALGAAACALALLTRSVARSVLHRWVK